MRGTRVIPLDWACEPWQVIAAWPRNRPLAALHSGGGDPSRARWTIIAVPRAVVRIRGAADTIDALAAVETGPVPPRHASVTFQGGYIGFLGYELGRVFEPAVGPPAAADDRDWPLAELGHCPDALVYDHVDHRWYAVGDESAHRSIQSLLRRSGRRDGWRAGVPTSNVDPDTYLSMVSRAVDYIGAGDIFQANITHRLSAPFEGSTRRLFMDAMTVAAARYGAYLELPDGRCLLSLSPELFLDADLATGSVVTRPVKGTRPSAASRRELLESDKDAAELNMIVDLMRNDLGRVCVCGSIRVPEPRTIETHPTVHHGVGEVTGRLRDGVTLSELLAATFPAGSVTGAPKIRAMQIIDELEPVTRGPYCGAIGFVSPAARSILNVAIRTIVLTGSRSPGDWSRLTGILDYGVGGGIVADSDPVAEYRESMDKAAVLRQLLRPPRSAAGRAGPAAAR